MNPAVNGQSLWATVAPDLIKGLPAAFVALVIGGVAGLIAWRQYRVARAKLNLDLFEQRYQLFELIWTYVSAKGEPSKSLEEAYGNAVHKASFIFGEEIGTYMTANITKRYQLLTAVRTLRETPFEAPERKKAEQDCAALHQYWLDELGKLRERFSPYMDFAEWH
ncbi:hypothetical protein [Variovorax atrisoli]|uniref:hypothetical protein n=1 Tax=Variovorax atrisoli TaxID=3394203 RepID=UPI00161D1595|nr:hypothetical protein [Variovorax sp. BK613]MBB3637143.1 hypothetical protein [Variovorax sp. BK613]